MLFRSAAAPTQLGINAQIDAPFAELRQRGISQPMATPARGRSQQMMAAMQQVPQTRPVTQPLTAANATQCEAPTRAPSQALPPARGASQPMMQAVTPSAAAAPAHAPYVAPPAEPPAAAAWGRQDARPATTHQEPTRPAPAATNAGALEMAAALVSAARTAGDPAAIKAAEEMAKMLLSTSMKSETAVDARAEATAKAGKKMAALFMGTEAPEDDAAERESGEQERDLTLPAELPDALLQAISGGLRAFPEVEWACVLTDGTDLPVIGVRVDPSFLNRVAQITDGILGIGDKEGQELQVLLLNTPDLMKSSRKAGKAFYPWKR